MITSKKYLDLLPKFVQNFYLSYKNKTQRSRWNKQGCPIPVPHAIKQDLILKYKNLYNIDILVETGTYLGDMIWAQQNNFEHIYSIELDRDLALAAQKRFKKNKKISIFQGNSGKILSKLVPTISQNAIFWIDAHYSGGITARGDKDCPVYEELKAILSASIEHVLLIDDARHFIGERDYPTVEGVVNFVRNIYPDSVIQIEFDCIVIQLKKSEQFEQLDK